MFNKMYNTKCTTTYRCFLFCLNIPVCLLNIGAQSLEIISSSQSKYHLTV